MILTSQKPFSTRRRRSSPPLDLTSSTDPRRARTTTWRGLINHLVGWARSFVARFTGVTTTEDPNDYRTGAHPCSGVSRSSGDDPQCLSHSCRADESAPSGLHRDGVPYPRLEPLGSDEPVGELPCHAAELGLETARRMLKPEFRGSAFLPASRFSPPQGLSIRVFWPSWAAIPLLGDSNEIEELSQGAP